MSQENVEIVDRAHKAWQRDDLDGWLSLIDSDVEWLTAVERGMAASRASIGATMGYASCGNCGAPKSRISGSRPRRSAIWETIGFFI